MFLKPEVETVVDEENGLGIIEIVKNFFKRTRTDFEVSQKRALGRAMRLKVFNVVDCEDPNGLSPDGKYIKIYPKKQGRIGIHGQRLDSEFAKEFSHLNPTLT